MFAKEVEYLGECKGGSNHDFDLVEELDSQLKSLWRANQRIANAGSDDDRIQIWTELKTSEEAAIKKLRKLLEKEFKKDCL